jgi:hypothetical protein
MASLLATISSCRDRVRRWRSQPSGAAHEPVLGVVLQPPQLPALLGLVPVESEAVVALPALDRIAEADSGDQVAHGRVHPEPAPLDPLGVSDAGKRRLMDVAHRSGGLFFRFE